MIPTWILDDIEARSGSRARHERAVAGGDIASSHRLLLDSTRCFLKWMASGAGAAQAEAEGLRELQSSCTRIRIPRVLAAGSSPDGASGYLLMEWIEPGSIDDSFWTCLGEGLAELHEASDSAFGFGSDNFIGATLQANDRCDDWPEFFATRRLDAQVRRARANGLWNEAWNSALESLVGRLPELLPREVRPSLVHGDLWRGNTFAAADGQPVLIDPAVYYGHAEVDLAMTELFGRFGAAFYAAYRSIRPPEAGYEFRRDAYNLYHLINHLNLFGESYAASVGSVLRRLA